MNTVEVALAAILWQVFHLRRNIVPMLPGAVAHGQENLDVSARLFC
jgi:hypothetical protein